MPEALPPRSDSFGPNAWLVDEMFEEFRRDPSSVSESWREFFEGYKPGGANLARPVLGTSEPAKPHQPHEVARAWPAATPLEVGKAGTSGVAGPDAHTGNGAGAGMAPGAPAATLAPPDRSSRVVPTP